MCALAMLSVAAALQPTDDEGSSLLQFNRGVQKGVACLTGNCHPKKTTTMPPTTTTTPLPPVCRDTCDDFQCPKGMLAKPEPPPDCGDGDCTAQDCCASQGTCSGFPCGKNHHSISEDLCGRLTCLKGDCCSESASCADYTCPLGSNKVSKRACESAECTYDECCEQNPSCADYECPKNFHQTSTETCDSAKCSKHECCTRNKACDDYECPTDFHALTDAPKVCRDKDCKQEECCGKNPSCNSHECPTGFHRTSNEVCDSDECTTLECCQENPSCASYQCPVDFHPISSKVCKTDECSTAECCAKNGECDAFECPDGFHMLRTAPEICAGKDCAQEECCAANPSCDSHECPTGFHETSKDVCGKQHCRTDECCGANAVCANYQCPKGFNLVNRDSCESKECTTDECCVENQACGEYTCPSGFTSISDAICNTRECTSDECCAQNPSCAEYECPADFHQSSTDVCNSQECSVDECCEKNQACDAYTCPADFHALDEAPEICTGKHCGREECCGKNPSCEFHACPTGYHQTSTAVCGTHECTLQECCAENPSCANYQCPDSHVSTSTDTCASETCTTEECCEKTTTTTTPMLVYCDAHVCPSGYEKNLRRNACEGGACTDAQCCDKQVKTTTTTTEAPPAPPPPPAPCGVFTCPAGQQNMCAGQGGNRELSRHKPVTGSCESRWGSFRDVNSGSGNHWHACDGTQHNSWLTMDLGAEYAIGRMMLEQGNHYNYGYRSLTIERSTNGHQFHHVRTDYNGHCAPNARKNHAGWSQPTRFVKVKFGGLCAGAHFAIKHWEIFGEEANGCTADKCCKKIPPPPKPSCMMYQCPAGYMRSTTGICESGTCDAEQCCEKSLVGPRQTCKVFGDPHVDTFDGVYAERLGQDVFLTGDFYLVNAPNVQIQGRLTYSAWPKSSVAEIMMKGDALGGKLLHIKWDGLIQWGNQRISRSHTDDDISIVPSGNGGFVRFMKDPTIEMHFVQTRAGHSGLLDLNIFMNQRPGVRGFCGNMNGNQRDDGQFVNHRASQVPGGESLWAHPMEVEVKPPEKKCEGELKQKAEYFCHKTRGIADKRSDKFEVCVFDYCVGGEDMAGNGLDFADGDDGLNELLDENVMADGGDPQALHD